MNPSKKPWERHFSPSLMSVSHQRKRPCGSLSLVLLLRQRPWLDFVKGSSDAVAIYKLLPFMEGNKISQFSPVWCFRALILNWCRLRRDPAEHICVLRVAQSATVSAKLHFAPSQRIRQSKHWKSLAKSFTLWAKALGLNMLTLHLEIQMMCFWMTFPH